MQSGFSVRPATLDDVDRAALLGAEIVRYHHSVDPTRFFLPADVEQGYAWWLRQEIERAEAVVMIAEREGVVVGYCYGALEDRDWSVLLDAHGAVHDIYVVESERRNGVARALIRAVITKLEELGANIIVLSAMVQNEPAQRLAASFGFRPTMLEMTLNRGEGIREIPSERDSARKASAS